MKKSKSLSLRRILVPVDSSKNERHALHYAIPLAAQFGARVTAHRRAGNLSGWHDNRRHHKKTAANAARRHLGEFGQKHIPDKLRGKIIVRGGQPYFEIAQAAREIKADLIVLTTHGYSGIKKVLLGRTAERIVRHACCPVLTVRIR